MFVTKNFGDQTQKKENCDQTREKNVTKLKKNYDQTKKKTLRESQKAALRVGWLSRCWGDKKNCVKT